MAWAVSHLINVSGKTVRHPVSVAELLGERPQRSPEEVEQDLEELRRRLDGETPVTS